MNGLTTYQCNLPDTPQELAKFVLIGREKLVAVRAEIRAITKVQLAQEVRNQKMEEARMLSEALLDAEVKLGDMTKAIPKAPGKRSDLKPTDSGVARSSSLHQKPKHEVIQELGFTPKQVERFEKLADNKDLVEMAKEQARENDDIPTRSQVLSMAQARQRKSEQEMAQIDADRKTANQFHDAFYGVLNLPDDLESVRSFIRGAWDIGGYVDTIADAIAKLTALKVKINLERSRKNGARQIP